MSGTGPSNAGADGAVFVEEYRALQIKRLQLDRQGSVLLIGDCPISSCIDGTCTTHTIWTQQRRSSSVSVSTTSNKTCRKYMSVKSSTLISISISFNIRFNKVRFNPLSVKTQIVRAGNVCSLLSSSISNNSAPCDQLRCNLARKRPRELTLPFLALPLRLPLPVRVTPKLGNANTG